MSEGQDTELAYLMNSRPEQNWSYKVMKTLLVGSHFAKPATELLKHIPNGARVQFVLEPENPYDVNAILVKIQKSAIDPLRLPEICDAIANYGMQWEELPEDITLGHVAASGGKPMAKAQGALGEELLGTLELAHCRGGRLQFRGDGYVLIEPEDLNYDDQNGEGL